MKSMLKTTLTLSSLLFLAGCWDFGWSKKAQEETNEVATHGHADHKATSKCSHKGCTHDHSKDRHHKKHRDDVKTQSMDDMDNEEDYEDDDMDYEDDDMDDENDDMNDDDMDDENEDEDDE